MHHLIHMLATSLVDSKEAGLMKRTHDWRSERILEERTEKKTIRPRDFDILLRNILQQVRFPKTSGIKENEDKHRSERQKKEEQK